MVRESDADYAAALADAYGRGPANCLCRSVLDQRKMMICRRDTDGRATFYVARYRETGEQHAGRCPHAAINPLRTGTRAYEQGVVHENEDDGTLALRFGLPLSTRELAIVPAAPATTGATASESVRLPSASSLGLLHLLWERAGLNVWEPYYGKGRFSRMLTGRLLEAAARIRLGRVELASIFYPMLTPPVDGGRDSLHAVLGHARGEKRRAILIGEIAIPDSGELYLVGATKVFGVSMRLDGARVRARFPRVGPTIAAGGRGVAIVVVEVTDARTGAGNLVLSVVDAALMGVDRTAWTPVDSTFELVVADALVAQQRSFRKPLRFDADRDLMLADFELRDVGERVVPMEVFGRDDERYRARAAGKHALYDELYGPLWWKWDATQTDTPPSLPDAR